MQKEFTLDIDILLANLENLTTQQRQEVLRELLNRQCSLSEVLADMMEKTKQHNCNNSIIPYVHAHCLNAFLFQPLEPYLDADPFTTTLEQAAEHQLFTYASHGQDTELTITPYICCCKMKDMH